MSDCDCPNNDGLPDLTYIAGDALEIVVPVEDCPGEDVDITNASAIEYVLVRDRTDTTPIISKSLGSGITLTGTREFTVSISSAETAPLLGNFFHISRITLGGQPGTVFCSDNVEFCPSPI